MHVIHQKRNMFTRIKSCFSKRKQRKSRYGVGYEDLLTDSCSLPSISESEESEHGECLQDTGSTAGSSASPLKLIQDVFESDFEFDDSFVKDEILLLARSDQISPGQDSAYGTNSIQEELNLDDIEVVDTYYSSNGESIGEVMSWVIESEDESFSNSSLSVGEVFVGTRDTPDHQEKTADHQEIVCREESPQIEESASSSLLSVNFVIKHPIFDSPSPDAIFDVCSSTEEASPLGSLDDSRMSPEDIMLRDRELFSALRETQETEQVLFETVCVKAHPMQQCFTSLETEVKSESPNIFEKARLSSPSPIDSAKNFEELEDANEVNNLLLVDEIDAFNLGRSRTPVQAETEEDMQAFLDTSVSVFPPVQQPEYHINHMFTVPSLFSRSPVCGDNSEQGANQASHYTELHQVHNLLDLEEDALIRRSRDLEEDAHIRRSRDLEDETTECSTLCPPYTDFSDTTSLDTIRESDFSDNFSDVCDTDLSGSPVSGELFTRDRAESVSLELKLTQFNRDISWAESEFIELPASLKLMWNNDLEFFSVIKFLCKWGKYNVIVDGTLDVGEVQWEDHIYFQSNKSFAGKGKEPRAHHSMLSKSPEPKRANREPWHEDSSSSDDDEDEEREAGFDVGLGDCVVVDRLFVEYQNERLLLHFNSLHQKSLFCGICKSVHIIEII